MENNKIEKSFIYSLDPRTKMLILLLMIFIGVMVMDPFCTLIIIFCVYLTYRANGFSNKQVWKTTKPLLFAFVLFFILNFPFATPLPDEEVYFKVLSIPVTMTGILTGLGNALRFMMFIWIADLITQVTPTGDIVLALNKAHVPPEASIAIGIAFSYIPVLKKEIGTIIEAQKSRGANFESKNVFKKIKAYIPVIVPGLFISIMRGRDIARAIEARGFTYDPVNRTYRNEIKLRGRDFAVIAFMLILFCIIAYLSITKGWFGTRFVYTLMTRS
ncbi:MAG: energy-coupling factor transporter transmembrane component T family protein [Candidatus Avilachnospira sp.]|jgi:energy-coupling factor transport system permease protein